MADESREIRDCRSPDVLFANLAFEECALHADESTAIIEVGECDDDTRGTVQLHHVEFSQNQLNGTVAVLLNEGSCSSVEMVDVLFEGNVCSGRCGAVLSDQNELTDVRIRDNRQIEASGVPAILYAPPESNTTLRGIAASENDGPVVHVNRGVVEMADSTFRQNREIGNAKGELHGAGVYLVGGEANIRRCTFEENSALLGAGLFANRSSVSLRASSFERNRGLSGGTAVHLFRCRTVDVQNCTFFQNLVPALCGAGILSNATETLSIRQSTFAQNTADDGGAICIVGGGEVEVIGSEFERNGADFSGGAIYVEETTLSIESTVFRNNTASSYGGAVDIRDSSPAAFRDLTCQGNSAEIGGCLRLWKTSIVINDSLVQGNSATEDGGAISVLVTDFANIARCRFLDNNATRLGGGVEISEADSQIEDTIALRNQAKSGAGFYVNDGEVSVSNCTFEANAAEGYGGGITCGNLGRLTVRRSAFRQNRAENGGGGSNVILNCLATFTNVIWAFNEAATDCGGGALVEGGYATYQDSIFERNTGEDGAGTCVEDSSSVQFIGVIFRANSAEDLGGGLLAINGTASVNDCLFEGNSADFGGAVFLRMASHVTLEQSRVVRNIAGSQGGGLGLNGLSDLLATHSIIDSNAATNTGGGIVVHNSTVTYVNVTTSSCATSGNGGGVAIYEGSRVNLADSRISGSEASRHGGGISVYLGILYLTNSVVDGCKTNTSGGALSLSTSVATIRSTNISDNFATDNGGGIYLLTSRLFANNVTLFKNTADSIGGGVMADEESVFRLANVSLIQNTSPYGGGVLLNKNSNGRMDECYAYNNSALVNGGMANADHSNLTVQGGRLLENEAGRGAAFAVFNGRLDIDGVDLINGSSTFVGGGIYAATGSFVTVSRSSFVSNRAEVGGGINLWASYLWADVVSFVGCRATADGGAIYANLSSSILCTSCEFDDNFAIGKGGAVTIDSDKTQLLAYQFDNCTFSDNRAVLGGDLSRSHLFSS